LQRFPQAIAGDVNLGSTWNM